MKTNFEGVFLIDEKLAVLNPVPKYNPFGDKIFLLDKKEYIEWNPNRSKLAAAIMKKIKTVPIKKGDKILYLGIAHGYTASKVSSLIGDNGIIYGVEFSERCFNELIPLCQKHNNIMAILADAKKPEDYSDTVEEVDVVYCDIAQPDQTDIAIRNCKAFLKKGGYLLLAIKSRSIDVTKPAKQVLKQELEKLKDFEIVDQKMLEPFEDAHAFVVARF